MAIHLAEMLIEKINKEVAAEEEKQREKALAKHLGLKPRQDQSRDQDPKTTFSETDIVL